MNAHTPGPWHVLLNSYSVGHRDTLGGILLHVATCRSPEDARLVAAAPDLLEALQLCSDFLEANYETRDMPDILVPVRLALAKVKA